MLNFLCRPWLVHFIYLSIGRPVPRRAFDRDIDRQWVAPSQTIAVLKIRSEIFDERRTRKRD